MDLHVRLRGEFGRKLLLAQEKLGLTRTGVIVLALSEFFFRHPELFGQNEKS